ncbi:CHAT domain-containing protein [Streptomyces sp. NBC_00272]|uniref:CHAT domain-containing protein n=1 Tax=Streptomyces sp. NBC_00272 TaxID=2975698 RepID=UPI002E2DA38B|nr:CHAT domain-containing protein [Streptomyces sp. NBC_00272]
MEIELLVLPDCPHRQAAAERVRQALDDAGLSDTRFITHVISGQGQAERLGIAGSPTILIDGHDPFGQPGIPSLDQLRLAFRAALPSAQSTATRVIGWGGGALLALGMGATTTWAWITRENVREAYRAYGPSILLFTWMIGLLLGAGWAFFILKGSFREAWHITSPALRILLPLADFAGFAGFVVLCLWVRAGLHGQAFGVHAARGILAPILGEVAFVVIACAPILHYAVWPSLRHLSLLPALLSAVDAGDEERVNRLVSRRKHGKRIPSIADYQELELAYFKTVTQLQRLMLTDNPTALDAGLADARRTAGLLLDFKYWLFGMDRWMRDVHSGLAEALMARYFDVYSSEALDEVIEIRRQLRSKATPSRSGSLYNLFLLGVALMLRHDISGKSGDLVEALACAQKLAEPRMASRNWRAKSLLLLGNVHHGIFLSDPQDKSALESSIEEFRAGLHCAPRSVYPGFLEGLVGSLLARYEIGGRDADLEEAISLARDLVARTLLEGQATASNWTTLGLALVQRIEDYSASGSDWVEAKSCFRKAAGLLDSPAESRLFAAACLGYLSADSAEKLRKQRQGNELPSYAEKREWISAAEGLAQAVYLMPDVAWRGIAHHDQRRVLSEWPELAVDAAAVSLMAGQPEQAVELLEQGRTVMWSQILDLRTASLSKIEQSDPELYSRLNEVRRQLDATGLHSPLALSAVNAQSGTGEQMVSAERRTALSREWEELMRRTGLRQQTHFAELRHAAQDGPVVIVNLSEFRSDALVISEDSQIRVISLPETCYSDATENLDRWIQADERMTEAKLAFQQAADDAERNAAAGRIGISQISLSHTIRNMLEWLWRDIARFVIEQLFPIPQEQVGALPRLWWSPAGLATYLPLHAAGLHNQQEEALTVPDRCVPSYTPTLRSLIQARQPLETVPARPNLLMVTVPDPDLPQIEAEVERVAESMPHCWRLNGPDATPHAVTRLLPACTYLHASCHGDESGGLRLYGGEVLTPLELSRVPGLEGDFAYLAACDTAVPHREVLDEATHAAAVLYFRGFRHVVASLSPIQDETAPYVAGSVYAHLTRGGRFDPSHAAQALHEALRTLRRKNPHNPTCWMPYIHLGP